MGGAAPLRLTAASLLCGAVLAACAPQDDAAPPAPAPTPPDADGSATVPQQLDLGPAVGVAAADLDGDGVDDLVVFPEALATYKGQSLGGRFQRAARGDIDGDGDEEALVATGAGRDVREAPARVWALHADRAELLWEEDGPRNQVADLWVEGGRVWLARFADTYPVEGGWLDGGRLDVQGTHHMGMRQRPLPDGGVVVGRLYGDAPRSDGDLRVARPSGTRALPSLRGVRALAIADLGGAPGPELLVGDGWHSAYGSQGDPRVRLLSGPGFADGRTIGWLEGSYAVMDLQVLGDGPDARVLAVGTSHVHLLDRDALGWRAQVVAPIDETSNAVLVRTAQGPAVAIAGAPGQLIALPQP